MRNQFSKIVCINVNSHRSRWMQMKRRAHAAGINVERFSAVDGDSFEHRKFYDSLDCSLTVYAAACARSHINVLKLAAMKHWNSVLVLEDDVLFARDFKERLEAASDPPPWKLLYLGCTQSAQWHKTKFHGEWYEVRQAYGGFARAVHRSMYDKAIALMSEFKRPADHCFADHIQIDYHGQCFGILPNLVVADMRESALRQSVSLHDASRKYGWDMTQYDM